MPVPTNNFYNIKRMNVIFAVSSALLLVTMFWMLWHDYNRPWRATQSAYFNLRSAMAHFDVLAYESPAEKARWEQLAAAVADAEAELATEQKQKDAAELGRRREELGGRLQGATLAYGNKNAELGVLAFDYEEAKTLHGEASGRARARLAAYEAGRIAVESAKERQDGLEDELRGVKTEIKRFYSKLELSRKVLTAYEKGLADARRRDRMYGPGLERTAFNFPGLDFMAPKGVPGRQEVKQVFMPSIRFNFNFVDSYVTDRCITCHVGIDDPGLTVENFVKQARAALSTARVSRVVGEERVRQIAGLQDGVSPTSGEMEAADREALVQRLVEALNVYLDHEGRPRIGFDNVLRAHPDLDLYVGLDSPHPMKQMGCTVCHEGSGQETDFVFAAHTPKNPEEREAWARKHYVRELGLPMATFHLVEEYWERPMLLPDYTSASCRKCHDQTYDLARYKMEPLESAARIVRGREQFTSLGCINCHDIAGLSDSRRVGTDLTHVANKLSTGFMERWIAYPNDFRPSTRMPHFFGQENNLPSSANEEFDPDPMVRTETEIQAITHYLQVFSRPQDALPLPEDVAGDPERGKDLFVSIGCLACHANLDAPDPQSEAGHSFGEVWIVADLMHSARLAGEEPSREEAKKRYDAMSKNDRVRYAMRRLTPERRERLKKVAREEEIAAEMEDRDPDPVKRYVPAAFTRYAPELSGIGTKLVPDVSDPSQVERGRRWLYDWLREPRHYHSYTKMPRMFRDDYYWASGPTEQRQKNDQDILDVAAYLLSLRNDGFDVSAIPDDEKRRQVRRDLILTLLRGQNTESVAQTIVNDEKLDPTAAYGELTKSIVNQTYRAFGGGKAGKAQVAALIESKSGSLEGLRKLFLGMKMIGHYGCFACHDIAGFEDATRPGTDMTTWAQKFLTQLDFAFYAPAFEDELKEQPEVFANLYIESKSGECDHLIRDVDGNRPHEILHNHGAFAYHKLRNPRIWDRAKIKKPYEKLKMPNFFLTDEESRSLVAFLLSRRDANVREDVRIAYDTTPAGKISSGRGLARELNCLGCHDIEGNEANIHQYFADDQNVGDEYAFGPRFMPPLLWGEGAKVQSAWLFTFLNNIEMLRPWLNVRMPSFYLTTEDTTRLVEYFAGLSRYESELLREELAPVVKHLVAIHSGEGGAENDVSASDSAWFLEERFAGQAAFLEQYALSHRQVRPYDFDVSGASGSAEIIETLGPTYEKIVTRAAFLSELFDVGYPFDDTRLRGAGDAEFSLGEELFYNQRCLACHVAGDPSAEGTTTAIKAPNFALTHERLRYDWVVKWLQDPQAIQPGANMPQVFQGGSAFAALPAEQREELEAKFGRAPAEQLPLLVDFLYELGNRRYTAIQPGGLGEAEAEEEGELEDAFEDEFGDDSEDASEDEFEDEFDDDGG